MEFNGTTYEPVTVMWPTGDTFRILMPQAEAAAARADGVIRFVLARDQAETEAAG